VVDGALQALTADPHLSLVAIGPPSVADVLVDALPPAHRSRVTVHLATRGVAMADSARRGADPTTSIGAAMALSAAGEVDAVISAGASGVIVAGAVISLGRMPGVRRPALTAILRGMAGPLVLLDVGAGMQVTPADLTGHASLGAAYASLAAAVEQPRVGLLSVGTEPGKGDRLRRAADAALRVHTFPGRAVYVGLVEGHDVVIGGRADVIVTDGFTGNVLLKGVEAALTAAQAAYPPTVVPRAAVLLGVPATVVVCHGAATGADLASGIALAAGLVRAGVIDRLMPTAASLAEVGS
jgi:glycerol-3-phosphate acyltransferase PlsX